MDWERSIIDAGYKALAKKHHPDAGGNGADFAALGNAKGCLVHLLDYARSSGIMDRPQQSVRGSRVPISESPIPRTAPRTPQETIDTILDIATELIRPRKRRRRKS